MSAPEFKVLGPLEVIGSGRSLHVGGATTQRLLAALLCAPSQIVSVDQLIDAVWGESPPASAVRTLQRLLSRLRVEVPGLIVVRAGNGYRLEVEAENVDWVQFERDTMSTTQDDLARALQLWRSDPFPELSNWEPARRLAGRLAERRSAATERYLDYRIRSGAAPDVIGELETLVSESPLRERAWVLLIDALRMSGRQSDALAAYSRVRTLLAEELGIEPSEMLHAAERRVLSGPSPSVPPALPTGTVTFLLADIVDGPNSVSPQAAAPEEPVVQLAQRLRQVIERHDGRPFTATGDRTGAVFTVAVNALAAAAEVLRDRPVDRAGGPPFPAPFRIGVHTGDAEHGDDGYTSLALTRTGRLVSAAHRGQVLVSDATRHLVVDSLPPDLVLTDLGPHRLRGLARAEHLWQLTGPDLDHSFPPLATDRRTGNLPHATTDLIGRDSELIELTARLGAVRLLTLTGVGGTGKTRLALAVASALLPRFPDGCWWCDLSVVDDPRAVAAAMAGSLGLIAQPSHSAAATIVDAFRSKRSLIIVDNCEHVLDHAAAAVELIVNECRDVTILTTSREPLRSPGEWVWSVPSLDPATAGAALFDARAAAASRSYASGDPSVVDICRRLDGLPLAIELAAARVPAFTPTELLDGLENRFHLLRGGRRRGVERHQTLTAAINWSYQLLEPEERALFDRLAVFSGGFDLEAAESVCSGATVDRDAVAGLLGRLVDRSLVVATPHTTRSRFRLLETLRQYVESRLVEAGDAGHWRDRHAKYFTDMASTADRLLVGTGWDEAIAMFDLEWDNIRAAVGWALATDDLTVASRLVEATSWHASVRIDHEHERWAREVVDMADRLGQPRSPAVAGVAGWWAVRSARYDEVLDLGWSGIAAAPEPTHPTTCWAWHAVAAAALVTDHGGGRRHEAYRGWDEASLRSNDQLQRSLCGQYAAVSGIPEWVAFGRSVTAGLAAGVDNPSLRIWATSAQGWEAFHQGHLDEARNLFQATYSAARACRHHVMEILAATAYASVTAMRAGPVRPDDYRWVIEAAHARRCELPVVLFCLARHLGSEGRIEQGAIIAGFVPETLFRSPRFHGALHTGLERQARAEEWLAAGRAMSSDEIVEFAYSVLDDRIGPASWDASTRIG